jgi:hypothetical protein
LLAAQSAFNLANQAIGQAKLIEGLMQGFSSLLSLAPIAIKALLSVATTALFGFGLFSGVSFDWGHDDLLRIEIISI